MNVSPLVWIVTIAVTLAFFVWEFFSHVRRPHEPGIAESARWSAFYIGLAVVFGLGVGLVSGWDYGGRMGNVQPGDGWRVSEVAAPAWCGGYVLAARCLSR